jgi:predicted PurR-regulated permease PerM
MTAERDGSPSKQVATAENADQSIEMGRVAAISQTRGVLRVLLTIGAVGAGLWTLHRLASVVIVLIAAALFAYVIAPLVRLATRPIRIAGRPRRLTRAAAIALVYALIAAVASGAAALLLPSATDQANDLIARAPAYAQSMLAWERGWSRYYERLRIPIELRQSIDQSVLAAGEGAVESFRGSVPAIVGALSYLPWLLLIPILAFFLLADAANLRRAIVTALPHHGQLRGHRLFEELNDTLAAYIRAQLLACVLVGSVCGVGFALLGMPYSVVLGVLAGVLEFIPLVGPLVLATAAAVVGALHAPMLALWAVGFLGALRLVEDYVIYPRLIRRGIQLHPLAVILAVLAGAELDGIAGVFLAVPAVAIVSVIYRHYLDWRRSEDAVAATLRIPAAQGIGDVGPSAR